MLKYLVLLIVACSSVGGQVINRAPHFIQGGDMARLAVSESTQPGAPVYTLQGEDPEDSKLHYSISGEYFTVDRETGVVILRKALDRETQDLIEVIISITDEGVAGSEPNTVSLRREIAVLDENDNPPVYHGRPYAARVPESARVGSALLPPGTITVTDEDGGVNADVVVRCVASSRDDDVCEVFDVATEKLGEGRYEVRITLAKPLDYERRNSYLINLVAVDGASDPAKRLNARATVAVDVLDVQDQPPTFLNAPYSAALPENTPAGHVVLTVRSRDGDTGEPRPLLLSLEDEDAGHFELVVTREGDVTVGKLTTTGVPLDREDSSILQNGGIYIFKVKATELINNEIPADTATSVVTIVVTDVDDLAPVFSSDHFSIKISEDIGIDTPLPGLNMVVSDGDVGDNARFTLALRDAPGYPGIGKAFSVSPEQAQGRVPVVVRATSKEVLDYDVEDETKRTLEFDVTASVAGNVVASSRVHVELLDANDHSPEFSQSVYKLTVPEDAVPGTHFGEVFAVDKDSGDFGRLTYNLRGFGTDKFKTDQKSGGISVAKALDYEIQKSYSLTMEARDGGGRVSTVNILIEVQDVNDNEPVFEQKEYSRTVREEATSFEPQLFVRATDIDGPTQGDGKVTYSIGHHNSMTENVFKVDPDTGEVTMLKPARSADTERGLYELSIRATDGGKPSLYSETKLSVRVGVPGNQRPIFRGNYKAGSPGPNSYKARLLENAAPGTEVVRVIANDPDGRDNLLQYFIASGAKDNFVINQSSGIITVSPDARLDLEAGGDRYDVVVYAVDSGTPVRETATTTVAVNIIDVNNKPPVFDNSTYLMYVSERAAIGDSVLRVTATDPDSDANLEYSIIEPIKAVDKTGVALKSTTPYDYKTAFRINSTSGLITVNQVLDYQVAAVIILTVQARDLNAAVEKEKQVTDVEVTIYVQAYSDDNPIFTNTGWSPNNPTIRVSIPEEQPVGTTLLMLSAREPATGRPIEMFELVHEDNEEEFVNVGVQSGNVVLNKRLDYETLSDKVLRFKVRALARDHEISRSMSEVNVIVQVQDINDNSPIFNQKDYKISVLESSAPSKIVLNVKATDMDSSNTEQEVKRGFGEIRYSLIGENADLFEIDPISGNILIAANTTLDRERQSVLRFYVVAMDMPQGGAEQKSSRALVTVDILDVNDNAPSFPLDSYTAVVPENAPPGISVVNITAVDPDEGRGGIIHFEIIDEGEANGLFKINHTTGEIYSAGELTGKGRTEPYNMRVRAQDGGKPVLFSDVALILYIGDVVSNDGVPLFIRPTLDEIAHVAENSTIGSLVFQVVASDPDDPNLPNGKITFKFLEDGNFGNDASSFSVNSDTGLITTKKLLDRETKDSYTLILVAQDLGDPPQQATRVLQVIVDDIDDHKPHFKRGLDSPPVELSTYEEVPIGTEIGIVEAIDEDIGENGMIDYVIVYGNEGGLFAVERSENNSAVIISTGRLDREQFDRHLLTVKCFKYPVKKSEVPPKPYNRQDPSERQILIKILDIDDNKPKFKKQNVTLGVRLNVPIDTSLLTLEATDPDLDALPMNYNMGEVTFSSVVDPSISREKTPQLFSLNPETGELRTVSSMTGFADGYMEVPVSANNSVTPGRETNVTVKVFLLRDRDMLKFVFSKPPVEVRKSLEEFEIAVQQALSLPVSVNVYDTQFYSKEDNSLDFSSTSSCFQMVGKESYDLEEMKALLTDSKNEELKRVYQQYHVDTVQHCAALVARADASMTQMWVLAIAVLVGIAAIVSSCTLCCMHAKYKKHMKHARLREQPRPALSYVSAGPGMVNAGSHTTLGPGTMVTLGPHEGPYEWGADAALYHPNTLNSRT
ncbi:cadherin-23 isoform X2 [Athalia rosae]|nr:cadherin-23 isoform X2 [Athalia rosae]XP_012262139.2 cadherin-23 isoform X2 [Athalia rosae]XP_048509631.1 cadherin-23 isoform X2 [Athalia rosae]XP_048509632.1 cadherin-23 isoform X2 [Athalia rosae]XP_048509633.1 cadherin-23 isoform X2 [Athalia rosae]XP_048509634.1 cadherin-23 isoform X2 [Athalia rosae]XP_048509635.1 cadherin-23 isoform X2 [Athalia rosae]XP_048509636.1 cadherin-23 isoform X2 [Athalia rosae]XP_048509637.1 cadherin-23 isoform X2 [Athalia rosae]XP_048509638.1 cadherin-23 is